MDIMDIAIAKALAGGGGGGGGSSAFVVNFTPSADYQTAGADKTFSEIISAINSGQVVIGLIELAALEKTIILEVNAYKPNQITFGCVFVDGQDVYCWSTTINSTEYCSNAFFSITATDILHG